MQHSTVLIRGNSPSLRYNVCASSGVAPPNLHTDSVEAFPELVSESQVRQKVLSHCTVVRYPGIMAACIQQAV